MSVTRKTRVLMPEQIRRINECRQSGMTDADWCRENGHLEDPRPKQDVIPIDLVPHSFPEQHESSKMQETYFNNSHTIEIAVKDITIRIRNDAEPALLTRTFQMLLEFLC